jgi:hypothetical protein
LRPDPNRAPQQPDDPAREDQCRQDEQCAEDEQPGFGCGTGQPGLRRVDKDGADDCPHQGAAPADRDPDRDLDRIAGREFARIDDADLRNIERAGNAGEHSRNSKDKQLGIGHRIAEKAHPTFGIAQRQQYAAELGGGDEPA